MANNGIPGTIANGRVGSTGGSQSQLAALSSSPGASSGTSSGTSNVGIPELPSPRPPYEPRYPGWTPPPQYSGTKVGIPELPPTLEPKHTIDPNGSQRGEYPIIPPLHEGFNAGYPSLFGNNQINRPAPAITPPTPPPPLSGAQNSIPEAPPNPGRQIPGVPGQIVLPQPGRDSIPSNMNVPPYRLNPPGDNVNPNQQLTPAQQALLNLQQKYSQPYTMQ
jgi:hypothetical protein